MLGFNYSDYLETLLWNEIWKGSLTKNSRGKIKTKIIREEKTRIIIEKKTRCTWYGKQTKNLIKTKDEKQQSLFIRKSTQIGLTIISSWLAIEQKLGVKGKINIFL